MWLAIDKIKDIGLLTYIYCNAMNDSVGLYLCLRKGIQFLNEFGLAPKQSSIDAFYIVIKAL